MSDPTSAASTLVPDTRRPPDRPSPLWSSAWVRPPAERMHRHGPRPGRSSLRRTCSSRSPATRRSADRRVARAGRPLQAGGSTIPRRDGTCPQRPDRTGSPPRRTLILGTCMHRIVSREIDETFREADGACWLRELAGVACALALTGVAPNSERPSPRTLSSLRLGGNNPHSEMHYIAATAQTGNNERIHTCRG